MPTNCKNLNSSNRYKVNGVETPIIEDLSEASTGYLRVWSSGNSTTGLAQLLPSGDPTNPAIIGYNILTNLTEANETFESNSPIVFKNISDITQATILDETNDKFLFPSNNKTFGLDVSTGYVSYLFRIVLIFDMSGVNNATTKFYLRLRRFLDDSIIFSKGFIQSDFPAETGIIDATTIDTFVKSETDPFVIDGTYIDVLNDSNSTGTVTLQSASVRIFRG
jgi:hypothetical protein